MGSLGMLFYVVECFPVNLENLAAHAVGSTELSGINEQIQSNRGLVAITLGETAHEIDQIGALHAQGAQIGDDLAQFGTLVLDGLLEGGQSRDRLIWGDRDTPAEDIELNLDAKEGLQNPIVEVPSDTAALGFDRASS